MLLNSSEIRSTVIEEPEVRIASYRTKLKDPVFISDSQQSLTKAIGQIENGKEHHFYSRGNFNLVKLICYLLKQTGPSHLMMISYSFSRKSIEQLQNRIEMKEILSFKVILDNRVRVMSPKPFQMIAASFNYRCISVHAKVALIWNDQWKISIVTSQNATDNPKLERGIIFTDPQIFEFDYNTLSDEFERGAT
ncbi:MAG: hypothetical protein WCK18_18965 [Prolixibacteraceae bacterium]